MYLPTLTSVDVMYNTSENEVCFSGRTIFILLLKLRVAETWLKTFLTCIFTMKNFHYRVNLSFVFKFYYFLSM